VSSEKHALVGELRATTGKGSRIWKKDGGKLNTKKKTMDEDKKKVTAERKTASKERKDSKLQSGLRTERLGSYNGVLLAKSLCLCNIYLNKYVWEYVMALKSLQSEDRYLELATSCPGFLAEAKRVDVTFIFKPVNNDNMVERIENLRHLPVNKWIWCKCSRSQTMPSSRVSSRRERRMYRRNVHENGLEDPEVFVLRSPFRAMLTLVS
jgi:hypothetical protein